MITCINMNICLYLKTVDIETYKNLPSSYHLSNIDSTKTTLRENCSYSELFWSVFFRIRTEYGEIWSICPYSVRMRENTDQNNSEYEHFSSCDTERFFPLSFHFLTRSSLKLFTIIPPPQ